MALELKEDLGFLHANWKVERLGWLCILLVILAGLSGIMGRGPLGEKTVTRSPLQVQYDHVMRRSAPGTIAIHILRNAVTRSQQEQLGTVDTTVQLWAIRPILDGCESQRIIPTPSRVSVIGDTTIFALTVVPRTVSVTMTFICEPKEIGRHHGAIGLVGGPQVPIRTFVLP